VIKEVPFSWLVGIWPWSSIGSSSILAFLPFLILRLSWEEGRLKGSTQEVMVNYTGRSGRISGKLIGGRLDSSYYFGPTKFGRKRPL